MTCTWINCFDSWLDKLSGLSDEVGVLKVDIEWDICVLNLHFL